MSEAISRYRDEAYLKDVLKTLATREGIRRDARDASIHRSHQSSLHRVAHWPVTALNETKHVDHYSVATATHPDNARWNRYTGVEPYDRTRLSFCEPSGRYFNASWVRELYGGKWWIATQAPTPHTVHAFLSVIHQPQSHPPVELHPRAESHQTTDTSRVRTVVQLTRNFESARRKADIYFPPTEGDSFISPPEEGVSAPSYKVVLQSVKPLPEAHGVQSTVSVQPVSASGQPEGKAIVFNHMIFNDWPDHGVPEDEHKAGLFTFIRLVDEVNRDVSTQPSESRTGLDPDPPILIHCSAGVGRTGAFIALSSLLRDVGFLKPVGSSLHDPSAALPALLPSPLGPLPLPMADDKVAQEIDALREQRPSMVQRPEQAKFVYELLALAYARSGRTSSDTGSQLNA